MINENIKKTDVLKALKEIAKDGVPSNRKSRKYHLKYDDKYYPPKYVLSIANKFATGKELLPSEFYGGSESNGLLKKLGFKIVEGQKSIPSRAKVTPPVKKTKVAPTIKASKKTDVAVRTVLIKSNNTYCNVSRGRIVQKVIDLNKGESSILVFPGGTYDLTHVTKKSLEAIGNEIKTYLSKTKMDIVVCIGIDSPDSVHQIGMAVSKKGILAIGRKFHPTDGEKHLIKKAESADAKEFGYDRTFLFNGKKCFLAVCYDGFGIKHQKLRKRGVDLVFDLIHEFYPKGEGGSGEVYFAKHGLAGAAKQWNCPVFGAVVFVNRPVPPNWPSGVIWNKGTLSTQKWKYLDNPLKIQKIQEDIFKNESVEIRTYLV